MERRKAAASNIATFWRSLGPRQTAGGCRGDQVAIPRWGALAGGGNHDDVLFRAGAIGEP